MKDITQEDLFQELKRIIEKDKVFMGSEFVSYYTRCAFGKKPDKDILEIASLLCREFKTFINMIQLKEKENNVKFLSFDKTEEAVVEALNKSIDSRKKIVDGDACLDKFKSLVQSDPFLSSKENEILEKYCFQEILNKDILDIIEERFLYRKHLFNVFEQHQVLMNYIMNGFKESDSLDEYMESFNKIINDTIIKTKASSIDRGDILNLTDSLFDDYITQESTKYRIPTRYEVLDYAFNGGFENGRVYMIGGISGGGKSLVMVNLTHTARLSLDEERREKNIPKEEKWGVLYLSLENGKIETQGRFVSCGTGISRREVDSAFSLGNYQYIKEKYDSIFRRDNTTDLYIVWRPPFTMNSLDIMSMINDIERTYDTKIKAVFIDYADKLNATTGSKTGQEWIDLGRVVDDLKSMAVEFDIPVVTVTQVNRGGYDDVPRGDKIAGSIRKRENADVLIMFDFAHIEETVIDYEELNVSDLIESNDIENYKKVWAVIDKNRDGPSNIKFLMRIDYEVYRLFDKVERISEIFDEDPRNEYQKNNDNIFPDII